MFKMGEAALENGCSSLRHKDTMSLPRKKSVKKWEMGEETPVKATRLKKCVKWAHFLSSSSAPFHREYRFHATFLTNTQLSNYTSVFDDSKHQFLDILVNDASKAYSSCGSDI